MLRKVSAFCHDLKYLSAIYTKNRCNTIKTGAKTMIILKTSAQKNADSMSRKQSMLTFVQTAPNEQSEK
jgi:hypothetical protein